jgi:PhnB protein
MKGEQTMSVQPVPEGYHTVSPYLIVRDAAGALDFYKKALDAQERSRMEAPGDGIMHAEFQVGDSVLMIADEAPERGYNAPPAEGGPAFGFMVYVPDVDASFNKAVQAGASVVSPVEDQFYGDRVGSVRDPFGYSWTFATHVEDVSLEEMGRRFSELFQG